MRTSHEPRRWYHSRRSRRTRRELNRAIRISLARHDVAALELI